MIGSDVRDSSKPALSKPLLLYMRILVALAFASVLDAVAGYLWLGRESLDYLWLPMPGNDYYNYLPRFAVLHTPQFFTVYAYPWVYPAPAAFVLYPFYRFSKPTHWHTGYLLFAGCVLGLSAYLAWRLRRELILRGLAPGHATVLLAVTLGLGWPLYFALQRGNIESLLWIGIAAGVFCYAKGRVGTAAVLIGLFGSAKLYPLLFLGLLFRKGSYRYLALGSAIAGLTTLAGLRFLEPDVQDAWQKITTGVRTWTGMMALSYAPVGVGVDHSVFGLLRQVSLGAILHGSMIMPLVLGILGAAALVVFLARVRHLPLVNQLLFLACTAILLPPASFDYTLVYVLIPWGALVLACARQRHLADVRSFTLPFVLFGIALAPLTFLHTYGKVQVYFEGSVRSVALILLMAFSVYSPVQDGVAVQDGLAVRDGLTLDGSTLERSHPEQASSRVSA